MKDLSKIKTAFSLIGLFAILVLIKSIEKIIPSSNIGSDSVGIALADHSGGGDGGGGGSDGCGGGGGGGGGGDGGSCCLGRGTKISMADGPSKDIENVRVGDMVLAWDVVVRKTVPAKVEEIWSGSKDGIFRINGGIKVTGEHPFWLSNKNGWGVIDLDLASANKNYSFKLFNIEVGDNLLGLDGREVVVSDIKPSEIAEEIVYNLSKIESHRNFFAAGVLVHNKR
ncbi:MAG: Hint domain-containing protein [Patescibacteria group bacterium]